MDVLPLRGRQSNATPGTVIAQHPDGDVQAVPPAVTPKQFLFHAIGSRTRTVTRPVTRAWHIQDLGRKLEANAISVCRCNDSAVGTRRFRNLKMPAFAIERTLSGYSKPVCKRADLLLSSGNRPAYELQTIWRSWHVARIAVATCRSVRELPTICCQSGNYRTRTKKPLRRLHAGCCGASGSPTAANRTLLGSRLSPCQRFAAGGAS
jgi:hypothetical protein